MGRYGRDPEFLKEVRVPVSNYIYEKAAFHLQSENAQKNYLLHYNLTGNFGKLLPHYIRKENYETIKLNIDKLHLKEGYTGEAIKDYGKFGYMNLSNIFEYMTRDNFASTARELIEGSDKDGKLAYWNLMVPARISELFPGKVDYEKELSAKLTQKDKGFFYNQFIVDKVK